MNTVTEFKKHVTEEHAIAILKSIYDPEIPLNIYDLGLIYKVEVDDRDLRIDMTLTTPNCPVAESLPQEVQYTLQQIPDIDNVILNLVWEPPWNHNKLSEAAKLQLGLV